MASAAEQLAANFNFGALGKAKDLQRRLLFMFGALIIYRIGTYIPIPGIDPVVMQSIFESQSGGILGMFNMFSGGALGRMTIFALNIMPYISASIIIQLMTTVSPIASRAMMAEPARICCTFAALRKRWLSIVAAPTTITSASTIPSSLKRARNSAKACDPERGTSTPFSSATEVTRPRRSVPSRRA